MKGQRIGKILEMWNICEYTSTKELNSLGTPLGSIRMHWNKISNVSECAQIHWEIFPKYIWWFVGGKGLSLYWYECRMDILAYMRLRIKKIVMGSDKNLLGIIGNLLEELWAFLWKCELIKCSIIVPFIYNSYAHITVIGIHSVYKPWNSIDSHWSSH